ncbi:DNA phosphorothioation system sulfurtransferase DndC [Nitratiruptor sp. SB155-2]|uniref:DNA phosphorothioation system sulfurtransferase DndC n=1 Tax=Nitratiruptor sp. (strain SB155-2) TaxID=387092 RepID=UPI000158740D|nr:DNA phosphorothioation system sulfurtransferase DndC [Nitratiruptor sp. SB155-2]BAF70787.1 phosphoadenosine phosphosulfate reductase [Nitratiruptor sp. SB155-2]
MLEEKVKAVKQKLREEFLIDNRPWVITFSGGKDSTAVLQLTIEMLLDLKEEGYKDLKKVYIVSSDTKVEMPIIEEYLDNKLQAIQDFIDKSGLNLNIEIKVLKPKVSETFWTLLLGKGYPSPNQNFRWCTDRLKIKPATYFLKNLAYKHKSIIMLLGVRSAESQNRAQSIEKRVLNHRGFSKHDSIPNAFVFSPIRDWSNADVWTYLSKNQAPWGSHKDMMKLYDKGSGEADCNIALNPEAPSCGKTRFGCWVCTVVSKDKSMENMLRNEEDLWMAPLHEFRNKLEIYRYDHSKRQNRRRNGQKAVGPFLLSIRQELFQELLEIEKQLAPNLKNKKLISDEEILEIQKLWNHDGDIFDTAIKIANQYGRNLKIKNMYGFDEKIKEKIVEKCKENKVSAELVEKVIQLEYDYKNQFRRYGLLVKYDELITGYVRGQLNEV